MTPKSKGSPSGQPATPKIKPEQQHRSIKPGQRNGQAVLREPFDLSRVLLNDTWRLIQDANPGIPIPDTRNARDDLKLLARLMTRRMFLNRIETWAPWLAAEAGAIWDEASALPKPTAREIGLHFALEWKDRCRLGIRNVPATDASGPTLKKLKADRRRELDRARKRRKRAKQGRISRARYLANALSARQPWKAAGVSRATWYRRQRTSKA